MVHIDVAPRGGFFVILAFKPIVHGKPQPQRFHQKHFQNGNPRLPAAVAPATTFALENDADCPKRGGAADFGTRVCGA